MRAGSHLAFAPAVLRKNVSPPIGISTWFFVTFVAQDRVDDPEARREAELPDKGSSWYIYVKVDDLDDYHEAAVSKGLKPASEPRMGHGRTREFVLGDPDGYKLVFFEKK